MPNFKIFWFFQFSFVFCRKICYNKIDHKLRKTLHKARLTALHTICFADFP